MANPISTFPPVPTATNEQDYNTESDLFFGHFTSPFTAEMNAAILAMNLNDVSDTSTTSNIINLTPGKVFTVSSGKGFLSGNYLIIADNAAPTTNSMVVQVVSYTGSTLTVDPVSIEGGGTKSDWVISFSAKPPPGIGDHEVYLTSGNGEGSSSTNIRRFSVSQLNVGTAITYNSGSESTLGATFTINKTALYAIEYSDIASSTINFGVSVNSSQLTTAITSINAVDRLSLGINPVSNLSGFVSCSVKLTSGDVIRPHTGGAMSGTNPEVYFRIRKIADL